MQLSTSDTRILPPMDAILQNQRNFSKNLQFVNANDIERLITVCCKDPWLQSAVLHASSYDWNMFQAYILIWKCPGHLLRHSVETDVVEWALKGSWFQGIRSFKHHREHFTPWSGSLILLCETVKDGLRGSTESRVGSSGSELGAKYLENFNSLRRIAVRGIPSVLKGSAGVQLWKVNHKDLRREKSAGKGSLKYLLMLNCSLKYLLKNVTSSQIIQWASRKEAYILLALSHPNYRDCVGLCWEQH